MKQPMKLPALRRDLTADIEVRSGDRITFPFASDAPVERGFGREILDLRGMDTTRFAQGAVPLLFNHNWDNVVGMAEKAWVGTDKRGYVQAKFFDHPDAQKVRSMVAGGLRNVSFGYRVTEYEDAGNGDYIARSFEPHEVSIVSVPADASVGVGRSEDNEHLEVRILRTGSEMAESTAALEDEHMTEKDSSAATSAEMIRDEMDGKERLRGLALDQLADEHGIHKDVLRAWKAEGISMAEAQRQVIRVMAERTKADNAVTAIGMSPREERQYSLIRAINAVVHKDWKHAGLELVAHRRDLLPDPGGRVRPQGLGGPEHLRPPAEVAEARELAGPDLRHGVVGRPHAALEPFERHARHLGDRDEGVGPGTLDGASQHHPYVRGALEPGGLGERLCLPPGLARGGVDAVVEHPADARGERVHGSNRTRR
jgi:HK97 family phage prohead protease